MGFFDSDWVILKTHHSLRIYVRVRMAQGGWGGGERAILNSNGVIFGLQFSEHPKMCYLFHNWV